MVSQAKGAEHFLWQNIQRHRFICSIVGATVSSCSRKDGKRSKLVLNFKGELCFSAVYE